MTQTHQRGEPGPRTRLTRQRVLNGALALADEIGIESFTMRRLADALAVGPMTIYHHVAGKEEIIDGIVDLVFAEIALPPRDQHWDDAMRTRCHSAREVLARHPWAPPFMESRRTPGPATLLHHDEVLACLRRGGLSWELTSHAYAIIDSYVYGFALQESALPSREEGDLAELAQQIMSAVPTDTYPALSAFTVDYVLKPGYSFARSFPIGLDVILDGIARMHAAD